MRAFPTSEQISILLRRSSMRLEHYDSLSIREQSIMFWPSSGEWHSYQLTCSELASIREFKKLRQLLQ